MNADRSADSADARYRAIFENSHDAILLTRPADGVILAANPAACTLFGYSQQELLSRRRDDLLDPADTRLSEAWVERADAGAIAAELTLVRKGGARFEARVSSRLFIDESAGQVASTNIQDISDRKRVEEALRQSEERFRLLFEHAPVGILQVDHRGRLTTANRKFREISGYSPEEAHGFGHSDITLPEDRSVVSQHVEDLLSGKADVMNYEKRLVRKDGSTTWVRVTGRAMRDSHGAPRWGIALYEDIDERKRAEDALQHSEEKFRATFEQAPLGIAECTIDGRFIEVNSKLSEILGYTKEELPGLTFTDVTHPGDLERTLANLHKLTTGASSSYVMEKRYIRKDRSFVWVNVTASLRSAHGKPPYLILMVEEITARRLARENLKTAMELSYHQANHDVLTGLANRAAFTARLRDALAYAKRDGHHVAIHMLDLDRFKSVNDTLGHHVGDLLLTEVARRIQSHVRTTDLVARLGGDEFVVIQTHLAMPSAASVVADKLVADLKRKYILADQEVESGASIGVAIYPDDAEDPDELIKYADMALYDAKSRGRFNYQFYRRELGAAVLEAQQMDQELLRALQENEFFLNYQPQFDLKTGRMTGIDALLRWHHPTRGRLAAAAFIQDAERARLILPIGEWVIRTACTQYKAWIDGGLLVPLTLKLSPTQLRDRRLVETLQRILHETGVPPSMVQLAIREGVLWDPKFPTSLMTQMKEAGLRLAIYDFGTEMTALATLDRFPLDAVNPGHALVRALPGRQHGAAIFTAIVDVAHDLNMRVCAPGVETQNQLTSVKEQGCDSAQGYLLSVPLDADEMQRLIENRPH